MKRREKLLFKKNYIDELKKGYFSILSVSLDLDLNLTKVKYYDQPKISGKERLYAKQLIKPCHNY